MATVAKAEAYRNFIGGQWVDAPSGRTFENRNPATGELLGVYPRSGADDVARAVAAAAQAQPAWAAVPAPRRGEILFRAAERIRDRKEELARVMTREMGKVLLEARGDVQEGVDMTYFIAGEGRRLLGHTTPSELPEKFNLTVREPVGVVALITPWNFPFAIPTWKMMPALVAGNTVVFKPAEDTPETALRLLQILEEAGLPPGVANLVFGKGTEVGEPLALHPDVDVISFTGSTEVGHHLAGKTGALGKRISLEMGGKNAITVLEDADLELAVEGILWSAFGTSGQRCTAGSRVIAHEAIHDELVERVVERARRLRLGDGLDPETEVGPLVNRAQLERVHGYTEIGKREGAALAVGGEIAGEGALGRGSFYRPTVFTDVAPGMRIAREEIFGPTTSFLKVRSLEEAIRVNNGVPYGLSSSVYTRDVNRAFRALRGLATGIVYVNAGTIGAEVHLPFGGVRSTGNGHREAGQTALDAFTEWKAIYVDYSGKLQRAQIDTAE
jgi:aldehyde dehydrogenase (NAD+)